MEGHVDLGVNLESYVDRLVQDGDFASREDAIREGVRLLQEREKAARLADLRHSLERSIEDCRAGRGANLDDVTGRLTEKYRAMAQARGAQ